MQKKLARGQRQHFHVMLVMMALMVLLLTGLLTNRTYQADTEKEVVGKGPQPLRLIFCSSPNYAPVTDVFNASLMPLIDSGKVDMMDCNVDMSQAGGEFGFGTSSWRNSILAKLRHAMQVMNEVAEEEERIVVLDTDIQFFQPERLFDLVEFAQKEQLDFYGMQEGKSDGFNGGFYILRNCPGIRSFYQKMIDEVEVSHHKFVDQEIMKNLIYSGEFNITHAKIDRKYAIFGKKAPVGNESIFHHAVCALNVEEKLHQMQEVKAKFEFAH